MYLVSGRAQGSEEEVADVLAMVSMDEAKRVQGAAFRVGASRDTVTRQVGRHQRAALQSMPPCISNASM